MNGNGNFELKIVVTNPRSIVDFYYFLVLRYLVLNFAHSIVVLKLGVTRTAWLLGLLLQT